MSTKVPSLLLILKHLYEFLVIYALLPSDGRGRPDVGDQVPVLVQHLLHLPGLRAQLARHDLSEHVSGDLTVFVRVEDFKTLEKCIG